MTKNIVAIAVVLSILFAAVMGVVTLITLIAAIINGNWGAFVTALIISIIAQVILSITKQVARVMKANNY